MKNFVKGVGVGICLAVVVLAALAAVGIVPHTVDKTTPVTCSVWSASTITVEYDEPMVPQSRQRVARVKCDFAAAGVPKSKNYDMENGSSFSGYQADGSWEDFSRIAAGTPKITVGSTFACMATWLEYRYQFMGDPQRLRLTNCRLSS